MSTVHTFQVWNVGSVPQIILISLHRQFSMRLSSDLLQRVTEIELYIPSPRHGRGVELSLTSGVSTGWPIRGLCPSHVICLDQSEASVRVIRIISIDTLSLWSGQCWPDTSLWMMFCPSHFYSASFPPQFYHQQGLGRQIMLNDSVQKKLCNILNGGKKASDCCFYAGVMFVTRLRMGWRCHD